MILPIFRFSAVILASLLMAFVTAVRTVRAEYDVNPSARISVHAYTDDGSLIAMIRENEDLIRALAGIETLHLSTMATARVAGAAVAVIDGAELAVPLKGIVDFAAETARLSKEKEKLEKLASGVEKKLSNEGFLSRAPAEIIEKEKQKLRDASDRLTKIGEALARIAELEKA